MSLGLLFILAVELQAQPAIRIDDVRNAASLFPTRGYLTAGIAQGSRFVLLGSGFLPPDTARVEAQGYPLPQELAGVSVQFKLTASTASAWLVSVSDSRIEGVLPSNAPRGNGTLLVKTATGANDARVFLASQKFGIYTQNKLGAGPAIAYQTEGDQTVSNDFWTSASPGQTVTLLGTGLGARTGSDEDTPSPEPIAANIRLMVGGRQAQVLYKGRSERGAGLDEVQFIVPDDVDGCYVPVVAETDVRITTSQIMDEGPFSNYATISVAANGGRCTDPTGLSPDELDLLSKSGALRLGVINLSRDPSFDPRIQYTDAIQARFGSYDALTLLRSSGIYGLPMPGSCVSGPIRLIEPPPQPAPLDAGAALRLNGRGDTRQVVRQPDGAYSAQLSANYLAPGDYTIANDEGGADIGPFQASFTVAQPARWTNKSLRAIDFEPVQWSGGDPDSIVLITGIGFNNFGGISSVCTERAAKSSFRVPTSTYRTLGERGEFGSYPFVASFASLASFARFNAPGLDVGFVAVMLHDSIYIP